MSVDKMLFSRLICKGLKKTG